MTRRKKLLVSAILTLIFLVGIGYFVINVVLDRASRRAMGQLAGLAKQQGLEVVEPGFESVRLSGLIAATWTDVRAGLKLSEVEAVASDRLWQAHANRLHVQWSMSGPSTLAADRVVIDGSSSSESDDENVNGDDSSERRIELRDVRCKFDLELLDPQATLARLMPEIGRLASEAETSLPLDLTGTLSFTLKGEPALVDILVKQEDDAYAIRLDPEDVAPLSTRFDEKLMQGEVDLVAANPLRAIRLLRIKDRAESKSALAHEHDASVPQDAYRHVLWSFLLAKEYGAEFAKQVGYAHETGDTGNTPAEQEMDLHNNAIGRAYAEEDITEQQVLPRLLDDPNVRREP